jgi:microcystin-dependent protein
LKIHEMSTYSLCYSGNPGVGLSGEKGQKGEPVGDKRKAQQIRAETILYSTRDLPLHTHHLQSPKSKATIATYRSRHLVHQDQRLVGNNVTNVSIRTSSSPRVPWVPKVNLVKSVIPVLLAHQDQLVCLAKKVYQALLDHE